MKNALYSVFDRGVSAFNPPMMFQNEAMLKRGLNDLFLAEGQKHELERHAFVRFAESYDVYYLGDFDTDNGVLSGSQPVMIVRLAEFVAVGR